MVGGRGGGASLDPGLKLAYAAEMDPLTNPGLVDKRDKKDTRQSGRTNQMLRAFAWVEVNGGIEWNPWVPVREPDTVVGFASKGNKKGGGDLSHCARRRIGARIGIGMPWWTMGQCDGSNYRQLVIGE